jgi:hypothetical protein
MSKVKAQELGLSWLVEIGAHGVVAGPDSSLQSSRPTPSRRPSPGRASPSTELDIVEINEAFAAVSLASTRELGVDPAKVNRTAARIIGGQHPIGMSGARITLHAALELARRGSGYAVAALCGAGGQGDALDTSGSASGFRAAAAGSEAGTSEISALLAGNMVCWHWGPAVAGRRVIFLIWADGMPKPGSRRRRKLRAG